MPGTPTPLDTLRPRLQAHLQALEHGLLERETATRLLLLAALAGEHVLLIGPPGTAKSALARRLHQAFGGARYFERLLTRFSTPEELFGPLSLKALEDDRYERLIDGYLPTAGIAFLDEVFKANSAILNALLTLLNEREFDNGAGRLATPLVSLVGASNERPSDDALQAFHDRFLLRVPVAPVGDAAFAALLQLDDRPAADRPAAITAAERAAVRAAQAGVALGADALAALTALRGEVARLGLAVSDRRWRQLVALMRCAAATEGRSSLDPLDLWLVPCVVGDSDDSQAALAAWVSGPLLQAEAQPLPWLDHAVTAFEKQLEIEQRLPAEDGGSADDDAGKLALARSLGASDDGSASGGMQRIVSATLEARQRRHFSPVHVAARLAQVDAVAGRADAARAQVQASHDSLAAQLAQRLWLPPGLAAGWLQCPPADLGHAGRLCSAPGRHPCRFCQPPGGCAAARPCAGAGGTGSLTTRSADRQTARPPDGGQPMHTTSAASPLEDPYGLLAALPRTLWLPALVCSAGPAAGAPGQPAADPSAQRLADLQRWRLALASGSLPPAAADFGCADASAALRAAAGSLGLAAACAGADPLVEQVLRTLLWHLDRLADLQPRLCRADAIAQITAEFSAAWSRIQGDWDTALALLQGLGDLHSLRWDQVRGLLARREWAEAQRISDALKQLPELAALIRRLGRAERAARPQALPPQLAEARQAPPQGLKAVQTELPGAPGALRGIRLSDRIDAMLGCEAALLRHPVGRKLWRARRAEARLLTYDSSAVLIDWRPDPLAPPRQATAPPQPEALERGPIIVCLDTSGSMRGAPETIAKAVVLQAVRSAHAEQRGCLLISFGGPDELVERDLAGGRASQGSAGHGLAGLLDLMGQGFDGGTDLQAPIARAIARVHQARWSSADLLIVSDGEFGCTAAMLEALDAARADLGLRVQGVLVGDRETMGLMEVADDIFWVRDWRRHGLAAGRSGGNFSPVHSKSLTALYFPNALSARAARHRPG